jgi:flagellar hook protein FlgE
VLRTGVLASRGVIQSSAVEDSNVDLTNELVDMITAQRNYQANAQTIKTQDAGYADAVKSALGGNGQSAELEPWIA